MSNALNVANDLANDIRAIAPGVEVTVTLLPVLDLAKVSSEVKIWLVPSSITVDLPDLSDAQKVTSIDVCVQKKLQTRGADIDAGEVSELLDLVEQIATGVYSGNSRVTDVQVDPLWHPDHLIESKVFTSILTVQIQGD